MRMREATLRRSSRVLQTVCALAALLPALACGSSSETFVAPTPSRCAVQTHIETTAFSAGGGSGSVRVSTDRECLWSATSEAAWIVLQGQPRGQGDGSVQFTVAANADPSVRNAGVSVNDQRVQISQEGRPCQFRLSSTQESVEPTGGQRTVRVEASSSQCTWSADADSPWIEIADGRSGKGNGAVVFTVAAMTGPARTGTLTIAGIKVRVEQGTGCSYATGVTTLHVSASGGFAEVPVAAPVGCAWTAQSQAAWITIASGSSGTGAGAVRISVAPTDGPARTGTVTVAGDAVTVTQASGCRVSAEPTSFEAPAAGGTNAVAVRTAAGCPWSAASDVDWIAIPQMSGTGPAQVSFTIAANPGPPRSGEFGIAGQSIAVRQATSCTWRLAPPSHEFDFNGGRGNVLVIVGGNCAWTAGTTESWIRMEAGESGAGNGLVQFIVAANTGRARSGVVRIAGIDHVVRQGGR